MHLRHLNGTTGATQVLPFLLLHLHFTRPRGCPRPTFPARCPLRQVSFSVGSATPTNVSCAHFESSSDRSCAPDAERYLAKRTECRECRPGAPTGPSELELQKEARTNLSGASCSVQMAQA